MDTDAQHTMTRAPTATGNSPAVDGGMTPIEHPAAPTETHWSRILHYDLFAPARRGSRGGADDAANDE
ncbi:MAG TPA: hypothetical protein VET86_08470 [Casimicrobiaceae bacterium]|jgi:hypothetical protein|nr:hypothetical protein [Casimicrobiaceae bacterium]